MSCGERMTHDELMKGLKALLAVVELHKPVEMPYARVEGTLTCSYCSELCHSRSGLSCDDCPPVYPCPTIQAIEKELNG
jgi:hypothetical protein